MGVEQRHVYERWLHVLELPTNDGYGFLDWWSTSLCLEGGTLRHTSVTSDEECTKRRDMLRPSSMHPITATHDWIAGHPISFALMLSFGVGLPSSIYAAEIKQFVQLPPQRLNIWFLKSRIEVTERKMRSIQNLSNNLRLYIFNSALALLALIFGSLAVVTIDIAFIIKALYGHTFRVAWIPVFFSAFGSVVLMWAMSLCLRILGLLHDSANPERSLPRITAKLTRLRAKSHAQSRKAIVSNPASPSV